jgi:GNAT superfamily N-acetyltransferase
MTELTIDDESIDSSGALSVYYAAVDELRRRYGGDDNEDTDLRIAELRSPTGLFLVARVDANLAGGVGIRRIGEAADKIAEVKRLWVRADLRRHGVARALMSEIEQRSRGLGYERLYLETGYAQPEALSFYATIEWTPVDEFPPGVFAHHQSSRFSRAL